MDAAKRVLRYLCSTSGMGLVLGGRDRPVLTGHSDASWADDQATQRSSQGYTFSLGSGSVSWRSTRSSSVLSSSCEAEIYATAMAAQELRWLTYLLIDLGEQPRSPPVLYVDNKATIALCGEHRLEHQTKHIALRYFLARELQQRGQLCLRYVATRANTADVFTKALQPYPELDYVIEADASDQAVGTVLMQDQGKGLQPIAYRSTPTVQPRTGIDFLRFTPIVPSPIVPSTAVPLPAVPSPSVPSPAEPPPAVPSPAEPPPAVPLQAEPRPAVPSPADPPPAVPTSAVTEVVIGNSDLPLPICTRGECSRETVQGSARVVSIAHIPVAPSRQDQSHPTKATWTVLVPTSPTASSDTELPYIAENLYQEALLNFKKKWTTDFPWLAICQTPYGFPSMKCTICMEYGGAGTNFRRGEGATDVQTQAMCLHQHSGKHKDALHNQELAMVKVKSQQRITDLPQAWGLDHEQVQALLKTLFFITKTDAPIDMWVQYVRHHANHNTPRLPKNGYGLFYTTYVFFLWLLFQIFL
ncbi:unnamed protein product [Closterium sp. NIES-54]